MRSSTSLLGRAFLWIALQARNLNENLQKNILKKIFAFGLFCLDSAK